MIFTGDFNQHQPINAKPLFYGACSRTLRAPKVSPMTPCEKAGRILWESFEHIVLLKDQHRFKGASGLALWNIIKLIANEDQPTREEVEKILTQLNDRAISKEDLENMMLTKPPGIIILRHELRPSLNGQIIRHKARLAGQQLYVWRSIDTSLTETPLTQQIQRGLENISSDKTERIPTIGYFYTGMVYRFLDSDYPMVGRVTNTTCIARQIVLDSKESLDNTSEKPYVILKYPPRAIMVEPSSPIADQIPPLDGVPSKCIPITRTTVRLKLDVPKSSGVVVKNVVIKRTGLSIEASEVNTDYYTQGMSFLDEEFLLHITPPPGGPMSKANILVPLSRPQTLDRVHLLTPFWDKNDSKAKAYAIDRVHKALKTNYHLKAEMKRLREKDEITKTWYENLSKH